MLTLIQSLFGKMFLCANIHKMTYYILLIRSIITLYVGARWDFICSIIIIIMVIKFKQHFSCTFPRSIWSQSIFIIHLFLFFPLVFLLWITSRFSQTSFLLALLLPRPLITRLFVTPWTSQGVRRRKGEPTALKPTPLGVFEQAEGLMKDRGVEGFRTNIMW